MWWVPQKILSMWVNSDFLCILIRLSQNWHGDRHIFLPKWFKGPPAGIPVVMPASLVCGRHPLYRQGTKEASLTHAWMEPSPPRLWTVPYSTILQTVNNNTMPHSSDSLHMLYPTVPMKHRRHFFPKELEKIPNAPSSPMHFFFRHIFVFTCCFKVMDVRSCTV